MYMTVVLTQIKLPATELFENAAGSRDGRFRCRSRGKLLSFLERTVQLTFVGQEKGAVLPHRQAIMGKVHGSLARAGKVKSQTPKVEPQEKKKVPKGRAKKRILYNRRFVNVTTLQQGGKRRMNPNPGS